MKYESKRALVADIEREFAALTAVLDAVPPERQLEPGVWGDGWNVRDLVAHLFEWQRLFLGWYDAGVRGAEPAIPAAGYRYRDLPRLNRDIQREYASSDPGEIRRRFDASHEEILALTTKLSERQLFEPGCFAWTRRNGLVTYLGANTSSHYRFAMKVLRRWLRETKRAAALT